MRKLTAAAALAAASVFAVGAPAGAQDATASVVVIHGIPDTPVDVYVNGDLTLPDFQPETVTDALDLPGGDYTVDLRGVGADAASDPIVSATATVEAGKAYSIIAHLSEGGDPTITPFENDTTPTAAGEGGVVVRHTAAAPAVDVLANGDAVVEGLTNPDSAGPLYLPVGTISAEVVPAGTTDPVIGPADVPVSEGSVTIVYAIGSLEGESLGVVVQTLDVGVAGASTPAPDPAPAPAPVPNRVDTGDSGLAASSTGPNLALLATVAGLATVGATAGALALARRRQD